ncbi:hypothetical protein ONZ45_g1431 [Pleurotus djamor]|nr:hypothetical protein ONZ45_g1431 [Pleurotus djamor]
MFSRITLPEILALVREFDEVVAGIPSVEVYLRMTVSTLNSEDGPDRIEYEETKKILTRLRVDMKALKLESLNSLLSLSSQYLSAQYQRTGRRPSDGGAELCFLAIPFLLYHHTIHLQVMSSPPASASEPAPSLYLTSTSVNGNLDLPSKRHSWASCRTDSPYTAGAGSIGASPSKTPR